MNAWLFVHSEGIPEDIKPYRTFQWERKLEKNDFTDAVFEGKFLALGEFKSLETMLSRAEIYAKILGAIKKPSISLISPPLEMSSSSSRPMPRSSKSKVLLRNSNPVSICSMIILPFWIWMMKFILH
ncbi:hypothetical protein ZIOFF_013862 [Zingiber officinale]|uniref:Uncharacterized protein n=1 Tax=Zingiber officinale TaxID=94328 RepID=A0A8J5HC89_ZINOF|nr:hypothetical protein ZIOFF_013862 [Zingiber officinale]